MRHVTLIPAVKPGRCPACDQQIVWGGWIPGRFYCPGCRIGLRPKPAYFKTLYCVTLVLVFLGFSALGFRGSELQSLMVMAILPVFWLILFVNIRVFPLDLETTEDVRGLLYGGRAVQPDLVAIQLDNGVAVESVSGVDNPLAHDSAAVVDRAAPKSDAPPMFRLVQPEYGIAEALLTAGGLGLVAYCVATAATAIVYRINPDLTEARRAPRGFDMRAELRPGTIAFTNRSSEEWECTASIGYSIATVYRASFSLEPGEMHTVPYVDFRPPGSATTPAVLRSVARDQLWVECVNPTTGRSHAGYLE